MNELEVTSIDADGVSTRRIDELSEDERLSLEVDVDLALNGFEEVRLLCVVCLVPVASGQGHSFCPRHLPKDWKPLR